MYLTYKEAISNINLVKNHFNPISIQIYYVSDYDRPGSLMTDKKETVFGSAREVDYTDTSQATTKLSSLIMEMGVMRSDGTIIKKDDSNPSKSVFILPRNHYKKEEHCYQCERDYGKDQIGLWCDKCGNHFCAECWGQFLSTGYSTTDYGSYKLKQAFMNKNSLQCPYCGNTNLDNMNSNFIDCKIFT